jgi:hypothetical protein
LLLFFNKERKAEWLLLPLQLLLSLRTQQLEICCKGAWANTSARCTAVSCALVVVVVVLESS